MVHFPAMFDKFPPGSHSIGPGAADLGDGLPRSVDAKPIGEGREAK